MRLQAENKTESAHTAEQGTNPVKQSDRGADCHELHLTDDAFCDVRTFENQSNTDDEQADRHQSSGDGAEVNGSQHRGNRAIHCVSRGGSNHQQDRSRQSENFFKHGELSIETVENNGPKHSG